MEQIAPRLSTQGFKILLDIVVTAGDGLRIAELPYTFRQRLYGESKLDAGVALEYLGLLLAKATDDLRLAAVHAVLPGRGDRHRGAFRRAVGRL